MHQTLDCLGSEISFSRHCVRLPKRRQKIFLLVACLFIVMTRCYAAEAIYVITEDAIRRSGARTLPEALRLAPNLQVAQITASTYTISALP